MGSGITISEVNNTILSRPYAFDCDQTALRDPNEESDSIRDSVDSATSATQIKLSKCYKVLNDLNRAMDMYDKGLVVRGNRGIKHHDMTMREEMAKMSELVMKNVQNIIREREKSE